MNSPGARRPPKKTRTSSTNFLLEILYVILASGLSPVPAANAAAVADTTIPVMLGGNVVLTCPSQKTPAAAATVWMGPGSEILATRGVLSASLGGSKYTIVPDGSGGGSVLIVNDVELADDGVYRCLDADSMADLHSINVTVLVQSITVIAPSARIDEGSDVKVMCVTDGSKPAPEIVWVKQDSDSAVTRVIGVNTDVVHANGTVRRTNTLSVTVDRSDHLASYTCRASVSVFSQQVVWRPDVYLSPMQPWLTSEHTKYSNGDIALFRCVTSGSKPAADITWFVHNQPISDASATVTRQDREDVDGTFSSSSQLAVSVSRDMNGADVTCSVTNSVLISQGQGPREASMAVVVEYAPVLTIAGSASEVKEGDGVTFTCSADAEPPVVPEDVYLTLNDHFLPEARLRRDGEQFALLNVSRFDRGEYQCVARNSQGTASSPKAALSVRFVPACVYSNVKNIYASLGDTISVPCPMKAFPHDATVTWVRRSTNQTLHRERVVRWSADDVAGSELQYTARVYEEVVCYAENSMGPTSSPCVLRFIPPKPPSAPSHCLVFPLPNASRQIRCVSGDDGGSPQTFFLRVQGLRGVHGEERVSGEQPRFLLDGLGGDAEVNLTVCAVSESFPDSPVCADSLLLPKESSFISPSSASAGEDSTLYIVLGTVFGCCFIAVAVFIVVICKRRQGSHNVRRREASQDAEAGSHHHHSAQNQRKQEHDVSGQEGNLQESSAPDENSHETATADKTLLTAAQSSAGVGQTRGKPDEDSRLSLRSSRSLADNIRFHPNTKVYIKVAKKDERDAREDGVTDRGESVNDCSTKDAFVRSKDRESPSTAMSKYEKTENTLTKNEDSGHPYESARDSRKLPTDSRRKSLRDPQESRSPNDSSHKQAKESGPKNFRDPQESRSPNDSSHKQAKESGPKNFRDPQESRSTNPCSAGGTETRNPSDQQAAFSDMIRKTLQRNRSSLLPKAGPNDSRRQPTTASRPLLSLLGTSSDFPAQHSACSPSALSTSQTSLAFSSQLQESSDIYDVPKHSRDWQRAMSLLSLSAVGSGVFRDPRAPDAEREDDGYIDMTQGLRGGSVPDLNRVGKSSEDGAGEESPYSLVPSNKHAYINLTFDPRDGRRASTTGSRSELSLPRRETPPESAPARKRVEAELRGPGRFTTSERGEEGSTRRRWSSSEQKTLELKSCPPSTAILLHSRGGPRANGPGSEPGARQRQLSAKLPPAPQLKLYPGKQTASDPRGNRVEFDRTGDLRHAPRGTNTPTKAEQASWSPDDSLNSYARADRNPQMPRGRFAFNGRFQDDSHGGESAPPDDNDSSAGRTRVGAEHSQSPGDRRPCLSSVQRSPSYSRAVGTRETTEDEGEKKGEQSKRFPFCIEDYVIIPTPRQSRSSSECSRVESKESYC